MQEAKNDKVAAAVVDADARWVAIFIDGTLYATTGPWQWPMQTETVFCSDVMAGWPPGFTGTKSILHPDDKESVTAALQKLATAQTGGFRFRIITTYGEIKTLEGAGIRFAEPDEPFVFQPETALLAQTQKTETAQRMAQDLGLQKTVFAFAERLSHQGVWCINQSTGKTWFSDGLYRLLGLPPQSINVHPNTLYSFLHPDDHKTVMQAFEESLDRAVPLHLQFRLVAAGGAEKWVEQTTAWDFSEGGETLLYGLVQDVSATMEEERKCKDYEAALKLQKGMMQAAEGAAAIGFWQINILTRKVTYSDNFYRLFGLKPGPSQTGLIAFAHFVHPDDRDVYVEVQTKMWKEHTAAEIDFRILRPDGKTRYLRQKGKAFISDSEVVMAGTVQDITVQKTLEKKWSGGQQSLELKTATALQAERMAGIGSWFWNLQTGETVWSENFYEVLGQKPSSETLNQKALLRSIHPDDQKQFADAMELTLKEKLPGDFSFRLIRRGELRHLKAAFRLLLQDDAEYFVATLQDVTAEREAVQSLTGRRLLVEQLADAIRDQVMVTDAENNILLWNKKAEQVYKVRKEKALGQNFFDVLPALKKETLLGRLAQVMKGEEVRLRDEPGRYLPRGWFDTRHVPLYTEGAAVTGILHLVYDVTEQHNLHQQLTTRLQFIERLLEVSVDRVVALDRNMNYLYWNKKAEEDFGLRKEDVIGKNILEVFPAAGPQLSYADFRTALYGQTVYRPATEEAPQESHLIPVKDEGDEVTAVLWVQRDRSKDLLIKKQSQKAFDIINALNENYLELGRDYRVLFVNKKALDYFERSEEEITGKVLWEVFPPLLDTPLHIAFVHAMEERIVVRREFASPRYGLALLVSIAPTADGIAVAFSDIGFIKQAEQKLAEEHRRLSEAQTIGAIGSFEWNFGDDYVVWSDEMYRICHLEPQSERITVDRTEGLVLPEDQPALLAAKESSFVTPGNYELQHRILLDDGTVKWVRHRFESLADEAGNVLRVHGTVQDVTEQKLLEESLRSFRRQWQRLLENTPDVITRWSADLKLLSCNSAFLRTAGVKADDPVGKTHQELGFREEAARPFINDLREVIETGRPQLRHMEYKTPEGRRHFQSRLFPEFDEAGNVTAVGTITTDITELKNSERRLLRMQEESAQRATDKYHTLFSSIDEGFCVIEVILDDEDRCVDFRYLDANPVFEKQTGFKDPLGKTISQLLPEVDPFWKDVYGKVALTGEPVRVEDRVKPLGKWFEVYAFRIDAPEDRHVAVLFNDVTGRKKAEQAVRESEEAFRSYVTASSETVYKMSPDWQTMYNLEGKDFLRSTTGATASWMDNYIPEHERGRVRQAIQKAIASKTMFELEHQVIDATGRLSWVLSRALPRLNEEGAIEEWIGAAGNITVRKEADAALRSSEGRFRILAETLPLIVSLTGPDGTLEYVNQWWTEFSGRSAEDFIRGEWVTAIHPDDREIILRAWQHALSSAENYQYEFRALAGDGTYRWLLARGVPVKNERGEITNWVNTALDIHDRKEGEERLQGFAASLEGEVKRRTADLQKNLLLLKQSEDLAQIGSWEYEVTTGRFTWSEGMYRLFGLPPGTDVQPEVYLDFAIEEDQGIAKRLVKNLKKAHKAFEETVCIQTEKGVRELKVKANPVRNGEGAVQKMVGVDLDVTDLKEAEHEAMVQSHFAQTIVDASIDQMTIFDRDERFLVWNKKAEEAGGLRRQDVIGKTIAEVFPDIAKEPEFLQAQTKALAGEYVYIPAKRGLYSKAYQQWFYVPLKNEGGETYAVLNIIHEITDLVEAEEKLKRQNQELESKNEEITRFAFIASHDLKEPIRKIHTFSHWLLENEADCLSLKGKEFAYKITASVSRLGTLIDDITTLTQVQAAKAPSAPVNLNEVLAAAADELREKMDSTGAVFETKDLPTVSGNQKQLVHLFRNLLSNAIKFQQPDVTPVVEITGGDVQNPEGLPPGNYAEIRFTDNGIGFDRQYSDKIFSVFQRLHPQTHYPGTGIGLAICKTIMENHGGAVAVKSEPGKGSTFSCYFPKESG